jgi:hypothetical protein
MRRYSRSRRSGAREEAAEGISEGAVHPPSPIPQVDEGRNVDMILRGLRR